VDIWAWGWNNGGKSAAFWGWIEAGQSFYATIRTTVRFLTAKVKVVNDE